MDIGLSVRVLHVTLYGNHLYCNHNTLVCVYVCVCVCVCNVKQVLFLN